MGREPQALCLFSLEWEGTLRDTERETCTPTQPLKLQTTMHPACKVCWDAGGTEIMQMAKQYLI